MTASVFVEESAKLSTALESIGLDDARPTIVLVGGAGNLSRSIMTRLAPLVREGLVPLADRIGAYVVDGATDSGVMRMMGLIRNECKAQFPLIGVVAHRTVADPARESPAANTERLEPHHTHFILVPGRDWGDESPWITRVADTLAGPLRSLTVLINGGDIALQDVRESVAAGRPVVVVAGSGRLADRLADARSGGADEQLAGIVDSGLLHFRDAEDRPADFASTVEHLLRGS